MWIASQVPEGFVQVYMQVALKLSLPSNILKAVVILIQLITQMFMSFGLIFEM